MVTGSPSNSGSRGVLAVVEAAYAIDRSHRDWSLGLLQSIESVVGGGIGGFACSIELPREGAVEIDPESVVTVGVPAHTLAVIVRGISEAPPAWVSTCLESLRGPSCVLTSEVDPSQQLAYRSHRALDGIADGVNVVALDLDNRGFLVSLGIPPARGLARTTRADLAKAATHVLAALRLKTRLVPASGASPPSARSPSPEAVLSRAGRLLHAEGEAKLKSARGALENAVQQIERVRADLSFDPARAISIWKGLVRARWSLIDKFERDGRKYVVARENQPRAPGVDTLTRTESSVVAYVARGFTTKETAYALGISPTTVRVLIMRAARRCGLKSRRELLETWNRRCASPQPSGRVT